MLDIDAAVASTTSVTPGKLSLGEGTGGTRTCRSQTASSYARRPTRLETWLRLARPVQSGTLISPFAFGDLPDPGRDRHVLRAVGDGSGGRDGLWSACDPHRPFRPFGLPQQALVRRLDPADSGQSDGSGLPRAVLRASPVTTSRSSRCPAGPTVSRAIEQGEVADETRSRSPHRAEVWTLAKHVRDPERAHPLRPSGAAPRDRRSSTRPRVHGCIPCSPTCYEQDYLSRNPDGRPRFFAYPWDGGRLHSNGQRLQRPGLGDGRRCRTATTSWSCTPLKALGNPAEPGSAPPGDLDVADDHDRPALAARSLTHFREAEAGASRPVALGRNVRWRVPPSSAPPKNTLVCKKLVQRADAPGRPVTASGRPSRVAEDYNRGEDNMSFSDRWARSPRRCTTCDTAARGVFGRCEPVRHVGDEDRKGLHRPDDAGSPSPRTRAASRLRGDEPAKGKKLDASSEAAQATTGYPEGEARPGARSLGGATRSTTTRSVFNGFAAKLTSQAAALARRRTCSWSRRPEFRARHVVHARVPRPRPGQRALEPARRRRQGRPRQGRRRGHRHRRRRRRLLAREPRASPTARSTARTATSTRTVTGFTGICQAGEDFTARPATTR